MLSCRRATMTNPLLCLQLVVLHPWRFLVHVDSVQATHLGRELPALVGSCSTTKDRIVAVEVLGNLLERGVSCLYVEIPDATIWVSKQLI